MSLIGLVSDKTCVWAGGQRVKGEMCVWASEWAGGRVLMEVKDREDVC